MRAGVRYIYSVYYRKAGRGPTARRPSDRLTLAAVSPEEAVQKTTWPTQKGAKKKPC